MSVGNENSSVTNSCLICGAGERRRETTTVTIERDGAVLVFRAIPADICDHCHDAIISATVAQDVERRVAQALAAGVKSRVVDYPG